MEDPNIIRGIDPIAEMIPEIWPVAATLTWRQEKCSPMNLQV